MWWTSDGARILHGAEAALFREGLGTVVDMVRDDNEGFWRFNVPPFDDLQPNQKLALIARIGTALLREDEPMPKLTAILEATVAAVYEAIRILVEMEINQPPKWRHSPSWRELVLAACMERGVVEPLDIESEDLDEWEGLVDSLADGVLWDEDWKDVTHLDVDPKASRAVKTLLGIDEEYYVAIPPDPTNSEIEGVLDTLKRLTRRGS
jgi:hypothetical protein